jgi:hypothetical protein
MPHIASAIAQEQSDTPALFQAHSKYFAQPLDHHLVSAAVVDDAHAFDPGRLGAGSKRPPRW